MWVYMLINQPNSRQTHGETSLVLISLYWIVAIHQESLTVGDVFMCHEVCVVYSNYVFSNHLIYSWNSINPHLRMGNTKKLWPMICVVATQLLTGKQTNDILALKNPVLQWWTSNCDPKWLDCLKDKWYGTNIIYIYMSLTQFTHWNYIIYAIIIIQLFFVAEAKTMVQCYPLVIKHDHQNILPVIDYFPISRPLSSEITHVWYPFVPIYPISYPPWFLIFSISFRVKNMIKKHLLSMVSTCKWHISHMFHI